jgi:hypothetical protein
MRAQPVWRQGRRRTPGGVSLLMAVVVILTLVTVGSATAVEGDTVVSDTFSRADGPLGSAETGQPWTVHSGSFAVADGGAVPGAGYALATVDSSVSNATVSAEVRSLGSEFWLVTRLSDPANYWRFGRSASGDYVLQQVANNALGSPSVQVLATLAAETGDVLSCASTSAAITCSVDGVAVATTDDAFNRAATGHGLAAFESPEAVFDDFSVLEGPAPPPPPPPPPVPSGAVVFDSFSRADGALGNAETGQPWAVRSGSASVSGATAVLGGGYGLASVDSGVANAVVSVRMQSIGSEFWLVSRLSDGANYWRFGRTAGGPYTLQKIVNNGLAAATVDVKATVVPEAGDVLSCTTTSASLVCSVDGVTVLQTSDTFNNSATSQGLAAFQSPAAFDDYTVKQAPTTTPSTGNTLLKKLIKIVIWFVSLFFR